MNIPEDEQKNVLDSFWVMLQECERKVINNPTGDPVLKHWVEHWVEQWYQQWNRLNDTERNKE